LTFVVYEGNVETLQNSWQIKGRECSWICHLFLVVICRHDSQIIISCNDRLI
jgi:hypothetical protein